MPADPQHFSYESMGTTWAVSIWDEMDHATLDTLQSSIIQQSTLFDQAYSRFIKTSLVWALTEKRGVVEVPEDLVTMLRLYETLNALSGGACNPLIGFTISDLGYDAEYSLKPKDIIRPVPDFQSSLHIIDDRHIELFAPVLIDLGALGKGFFVDTISRFLGENGIRRFLVNGSGDIFYQGDGHVLRAGLEHPRDTSKVIGVIEMTHGALCASGSNRRKWDKYHHTINPFSLTSPEDIIATWVMAETTAIADGLATCLFLVEPERFEKAYAFEYCILNKDYKVKRSTGFTAELF